VYARTVAGRTLTFGVSGMLYRDALVMYDRETSTLWSQVDGRAIKGPLAGQVLQALPAVHATWQEWKGLYPDSLVLKKQGERGSSYEEYTRDASRLGIFGRRLKDSALPPKEPVLGVRYNEAATAFVMKDVREAGLVQVAVGGVPIVLASPARNLPVVAFERHVRDRVLSFVVTGKPTELEDVDTHSRWRIADGVATSGPLEGERLRRVTTYPAFWFGWQGFFPRSAIWKR
jgi:Protein of unknown function (DUF3179)